jgi:general secretion pathway protein I
MSNRRAFTLLEIVLALAILAGSLAALGEVMRLADRNAELVQGETQAQVLAESVMEEILAGSRSLTNVNGALFPLETEPRWQHWIAVEPTDRDELLLIRVTVAEQLPPELQPARFELVRWVLNPDSLPATPQQSSSSTTGSGTNTSLGSGSTESSGSAGLGAGGGNPAGGRQQ